MRVKRAIALFSIIIVLVGLNVNILVYGHGDEKHGGSAHTGAKESSPTDAEVKAAVDGVKNQGGRVEEGSLDTDEEKNNFIAISENYKISYWGNKKIEASKKGWQAPARADLNLEKGGGVPKGEECSCLSDVARNLAGANANSFKLTLGDKAEVIYQTGDRRRIEEALKKSNSNVRFTYTSYNPDSSVGGGGGTTNGQSADALRQQYAGDDNTIKPEIPDNVGLGNMYIQSTLYLTRTDGKTYELELRDGKYYYKGTSTYAAVYGGEKVLITLPEGIALETSAPPPGRPIPKVTSPSGDITGATQVGQLLVNQGNKPIKVKLPDGREITLQPGEAVNPATGSVRMFVTAGQPTTPAPTIELPNEIFRPDGTVAYVSKPDAQGNVEINVGGVYDKNTGKVTGGTTHQVNKKLLEEANLDNWDGSIKEGILKNIPISEGVFREINPNDNSYTDNYYENGINIKDTKREFKSDGTKITTETSNPNTPDAQTTRTEESNRGIITTTYEKGKNQLTDAAEITASVIDERGRRRTTTVSGAIANEILSANSYPTALSPTSIVDLSRGQIFLNNVLREAARVGLTEISDYNKDTGRVGRDDDNFILLSGGGNRIITVKDGRVIRQWEKGVGDASMIGTIREYSGKVEPPENKDGSLEMKEESSYIVRDQDGRVSEMGVKPKDEDGRSRDIATFTFTYDGDTRKVEFGKTDGTKVTLPPNFFDPRSDDYGEFPEAGLDEEAKKLLRDTHNAWAESRNLLTKPQIDHQAFFSELSTITDNAISVGNFFSYFLGKNEKVGDFTKWWVDKVDNQFIRGILTDEPIESAICDSDKALGLGLPSSSQGTAFVVSPEGYAQIGAFITATKQPFTEKGVKDGKEIDIKKFLYIITYKVNLDVATSAQPQVRSEVGLNIAVREKGKNLYPNIRLKMENAPEERFIPVKRGESYPKPEPGEIFPKPMLFEHNLDFEEACIIFNEKPFLLTGFKLTERNEENGAKPQAVCTKIKEVGQSPETLEQAKEVLGGKKAVAPTQPGVEGRGSVGLYVG